MDGRLPHCFEKMEEDLNLFKNGKRPQFFKNGRRHNFLKIEDDTFFSSKNGRQPQLFLKMEDDLNFSKMDDDLILK